MAMDWHVATAHAGNVLTTQRHEEYLMKKKLLSLAVAGASIVAAQMSYAAGPTVYGKLNVSFQNVDIEDLGVDADENLAAVTREDNWQLDSNSSRLGVMGDAAINSSLNAIYKLEYEVAVDDGSNSNGREFSQRNIYVGLQGKDWGTVIAGKNDSPLKMAQGTVDQFNDYGWADIKYLMVGENRPSNIIMYSSPSMSGLILTAAVMPGEETDFDGSNSDANDGIADYASVAAEYKTGGLRLAAAYDSDVNNNDVLRLVGEYAMDQFQFGALFQTAESSDSDISPADFADYQDGFDTYAITTLVGDSEQDAWIISGAFKANDKLKFKAQVGQSETKLKANDTDFGKLEMQEIALGADYSLAATTTLYGYFSQLSWDYKDANVDGDGTTFGVGIDHKF